MNELAIPISASEIPTERISESDRRQAFLAAPTTPPAARWPPTLSKGAVLGLVMTTLGFGILLASTINRPWRFQETRLLAPHAAEKAPEPAPARAMPVVEPIVVAAAPPVLDWPPLRRVVSKPTRDGRVRAVRAIRLKRTGGIVEPELSAPEPVAARPAPPPAKKWVDPFAD